MRRLNSLRTSTEAIKISYDPNGLISKTELNQGQLEEINNFKNGRLTNRTSNSGMEDLFQYDDNGLLSGFSRAGGESWIIRMDGNRKTYSRNNSVQMEFIYDEKGRLVEMLY